MSADALILEISRLRRYYKGRLDQANTEDPASQTPEEDEVERKLYGDFIEKLDEALEFSSQ